MIYALLLALTLSCSKETETCPQVNGSWMIAETRKAGKVICTYDSTFYYRYDIDAGSARITQFRAGIDSLIGSFAVDCNAIFFATGDSFRYGSPLEYALLIKI